MAQNGNNAIERESLISCESLRWWNAQLPETREGRILLRSVKKFLSKLTFL